MADRYWVGGTASWDTTVGTKWAATSGGAGGESVPTIADDVFFDANSTGTVTITGGNAAAKSINCTGFVDTITGAAAGGSFTVGGSVTLVAGMTYTNAGTVTFTGTGTLITAGKTFGAVTVNGSGITLTLGDALSITTRVVTVTAGTFDTASYNVTGGVLSSSNTNTRAITLGASTLTLSQASGIEFSTSTNLTFNAGTSQITMTAVNAILRGGSLTFYNVSLTNAGQTKQIIGANTFNDLSLPTNGISVILDNQTVSGTFTCIGNSAIQRAFLRADTIGTTRTITAAVVSANNCDFRDITIAGAAAPISPTPAGDCGGNSGITFPAAKTVYRVGTNTTWTGSNSWALTSGGAGSNINFPLAQDTAVIDESTALTGTLNFNSLNTSAVDCSTRTTGITLNFNNVISRYGSLILGSGITVTGTAINTFSGRSTMVLTSAGKTITFPIVVEAPIGTLQLGDALTASNTITNTLGTFDANNYNLTCTQFASDNSNTRTITMGSGLWTLSGTGTVWTTDTTTGLTFNKDTANILLSDTSGTARTFNGGGLAYNKLTIGGATGTSTLTIGGANSFTELASDKTVAHTITLSSNQGTIDTWTVTGTSGNVVTLNSSSAGTRRTFTLTNATGSIETPSSIDYLAVQDIGELSGNKFFVGINSTNNENNSNVYFTASPVLDTGNMFMLFH
jgi:hypothetical protein